MNLHRICKARYARTAFSGTGGLHSSGRWHHQGRLVIYAASTLSLAALEYFVHLGRFDSKISLVSFLASAPDSLEMEIVEAASLPGHWRASPPGSATMDIGSRWLEGNRNSVLRVPSAIVPGEYNYLLNPAHPGFKQIVVGKPQAFTFDPRMWK